MAIEKVSNILKMADEANTSAIAFDCTEYSTIKAVVDVAEELQTPVILMLYPEHAAVKHWTTPKVFAETYKELASKVKVPVGLHLDHCSDFSYIFSAIQDGFTSVMYDGSMLSLEENLKNTRYVADVAHALGADVEAELGHVGFAASSDQENLDKYTRPDVAAYFCEESKCDSVAVAIGSAHGFYKETPKLDIERLKEINKATDKPLVLHGGSGIPNDQLDIAFREGINKFNVGTEFFYLYNKTMLKHLSDDSKDFFDMPLAVNDALTAYLREKMKLSKF